jgi:hypothetical protein
MRRAALDWRWKLLQSTQGLFPCHSRRSFVTTTLLVRYWMHGRSGGWPTTVQAGGAEGQERSEASSGNRHASARRKTVATIIVYGLYERKGSKFECTTIDEPTTHIQ